VSFCCVQELWQKQMNEDNLKKVDGLRPIAEELGCTMAQLALAWAASNPDVSTVITGASKPQQVTAVPKQFRSLIPPHVDVLSTSAMCPQLIAEAADGMHVHACHCTCLELLLPRCAVRRWRTT
jgi:predicted aldo/keto reductase-like oxidoreductase